MYKDRSLGTTQTYKVITVIHVNLKSEQQNDLIGDCRQISLTDAHERILKEDRMRYSKMEDTL